MPKPGHEPKISETLSCDHKIICLIRTFIIIASMHLQIKLHKTSGHGVFYNQISQTHSTNQEANRRPLEP